MKPLSPAHVVLSTLLLSSVVTGCISRVDVSGARSPEEEAAPLFQRMDTNRDGLLSRTEFSAGFADAVFTVYNQPRTGGITADQWNGIERAGARTGNTGFAALDRNGDGKLTRDELAAGNPQRDAVVNRVFDRIDRNRDGSISAEEGQPSGLNRTPQQRAEGTGL